MHKLLSGASLLKMALPMLLCLVVGTDAVKQIFCLEMKKCKKKDTNAYKDRELTAEGQKMYYKHTGLGTKSFQIESIGEISEGDQGKRVLLEFYGGNKRKMRLETMAEFDFLKYCHAEGIKMTNADVMTTAWQQFTGKSGEGATKDIIRRALIKETAEALEKTFLTQAVQLGVHKRENLNLIERKWVDADGRDVDQEEKSDNTIRVCQFNVLAHSLSGSGGGFAPNYEPGTPDKEKTEELKAFNDKYLLPKDKLEVLFGKTTGENCKSAYNKAYPVPVRIKRALGVILKECPDIITVQELDHYEYFENVLSQLGYKGQIHKKADDEKDKNNGGHGANGVAIFWNRHRYENKNTTYFVPTIGANQKDKDGNPRDPKTKSKQRVLIVTLHDTKLKREIVVVTGHMKSGTKKKDDRMAEHQASKLAGVLCCKKFAGKPIIFACDFNKSAKTGAYKSFMQTTKNKGLTMQSAYEEDEDRKTSVKIRRGGEQQNKIGKQIKETIDYIFFSQQHFQKVNTLQLPKVEDINKMTDDRGLPSWRFPSDHLHIVADLKLKPKRRRLLPMSIHELLELIQQAQ